MDRLKLYNKLWKKERKEHPDIPSWTITRLVQDHMKKMKK